MLIQVVLRIFRWRSEGWHGIRARVLLIYISCFKWKFWKLVTFYGFNYEFWRTILMNLSFSRVGIVIEMTINEFISFIIYF